MDQLLKAYLDACESNLTHALERTPRKTNPDHFAWLVDFQIRVRSLAAIARAAPRDLSKGIHSIADRIGLALRAPAAAGRATAGPRR